MSAPAGERVGAGGEGPQRAPASERVTPWWRRLLESSFAIDLRSLAALRIALGLLLLTDLVLRARFLGAHYTDQGVLPRAALIRDVLDPYTLSIHLMSGEAWVQALLFLVAALAAVALLVGHRTRWATLASWLLLLSLQARNPQVLQAGDTVLRLLLFWSLFLPLGAVASVDAARAAASGEVPPESRFRGIGRDSRGAPFVLSPASAALLVQVAVIYLASVLEKRHPIWMVDATAVYYALSVDQFVTPLGEWLRGLPEATRALTRGTLLLEAAGPLVALLPWPARPGGWLPALRGPLRTLVVLLFVGLHGGFLLTMELGLFPWTSMAAWLPFLPAWFWERLARWSGAVRLGRLWNRWMAGLARRPGFVGGPAPAPDHRAGHRRFRALSALLFWLPLALLGVVLWWNAALVEDDRVDFYDPLHPPLRLVRLDQRWNMFAPFPLTDDGWFLAEGALEDGRRVELLRRGDPDDRAKPRRIASHYPSQRWRKYMMNLRRSKGSLHRPLFAQYLCRRWRAEHPGSEAATDPEGDPDRLVSVRLIYMLDRTVPPDAPPEPPVEQVLTEHYCEAE